ncbi:MAG: hypothetical protein AAGF01_04940 [Cyanobacteria bacterium P01_G01_bin.38]
MLEVNRIDIKTGLTLHETIEGVQQPKQKQVGHSYLEHWLKTNGLTTQFYMGKFYDGVNDADRLRLEAEGRVLVFTNGKDGYFTDPETARLITQGDTERGIAPIYASGQDSPHNFVAYGNLVASDGMASTAVQSTRILIIDDENRVHGSGPLLDKDGRTIPQSQLEKLYDKMGDGTMLVSQKLMRDCITPQEREDIAAKVFEQAGISPDITGLSQDLPQTDAAMEIIESQVDALAGRTVTQFRAATPDLPGILKGTMASSRWCERLGVDAIISSNDIKGDDGRLSEPGIQEVKNFWVNRKSDGQYGEQGVGPQVKGCIPKATLHEFNPRTVAQAQELAEVAGDPIQLGQYYVQQQEKQRERAQVDEAGEPVQKERSDWLYETLSADKYGQLSRFKRVNQALERYLKGQWQDLALRGVYVPSAMAQHHAQLKPWEVCNKDLPHGAIVAYYRSPFPNVGAAAISINNIEIIKAQDREAFSKQGVAYLPPWTAKNVAITDFDRDANGYFVGYQATVSDLPEQLRQQLSKVEALPLDKQYEAGRAAFEQMVQAMEQGNESRIVPATYPLAVKAFIESNAPNQKPPEIIKQKKVKHPWDEGESHAAATWWAWEITADNPTGKVANVGMTLQSLALETMYAPAEQREDLLRQVSLHYSKQLRLADEGKLFIPDDTWWQSKGFPAYQFKERMEDIAQAVSQLDRVQDPQQRKQFVEDRLKFASRLLLDVVNGPNAVNLQTAVDTAKSSRGIDKSIHAFAQALRHKEHLLRQHYKDPNNYTKGQMLPSNTQEPIGWGVEAVNQVYEDTQLSDLRHEAFRALFPKDCTPEQENRAMTIARTYNDLIAASQAARGRLQENRTEDQQPTLRITSPNGRDLTIQNLKDPEGTLPIWRATGEQPDWKITINRNPNARPEATRFSATLSFTDEKGSRRSQRLGNVSPESVAQHNLVQRLREHPKRTLTIRSPVAQIQVPFAQENDAEETLSRAMNYAQDAVAQIPKEERPAYVSALWRQSDGMGFALKHFPDLVSDRLQTVPEITLTGIQHSTNEAGQIPAGEYTVRFSEYSYINKAGQTKTSPSVKLIYEDDAQEQFGALNARSMHLPLGTTVKAHLSIDTSGKTARMQVLDLVSQPPNPQVSLLQTDANHCLYRFVNNDWVESYTPTDPKILNVLQLAHDWGLDAQCKILKQSQIVQAIVTIDFPDQSTLSRFEQEVVSLPIQFRYEGELTGGFQFVDEEVRQRLGDGFTSIPDEQTLNSFEPDGSFIVSSSASSDLKISSTSFTAEDHSYARFPDLMVLDVDRPYNKVLPLFQERCQQNPHELWALHSTLKGVHAMRLDTSVKPSQVSHEFIAQVGVDNRYLNLAQDSGEWTARINAKQGRRNEAIYLKQVVGTGSAHPQLLKSAIAYQTALIENEMDTPWSLETLEAIKPVPVEQKVAEASTNYTSAPSTEVKITGKPVSMVFPLKLHGEHNSLPMGTCIEAMRGYGRCHTTRTFEPHAAYGFKSGDIAIAQSGKHQVAFRVGAQYRITHEMLTDPTYQRQWAAMEKHSAHELAQLWQSSQARGKTLWGMKIEPLGDFQKGHIIPFPDRSQEIYSPSRQELRAWYFVAISNEDESLSGRIAIKGHQLRALYAAESGSGDPPLTYRHPSVVISAAERIQMQQALQAAHEACNSEAPVPTALER